CNFEQTICFSWKIEKQWCIAYLSNNVPVFVQFNTGFFWFILAINIFEPLRYLKYISDEDKLSCYNIEIIFGPSRDKGFFRGLARIIFKLIQAFRYIDLNTNNA
ncbi:5963_t:CDS:1, partial [Dentiscutata heterogama]